MPAYVVTIGGSARVVHAEGFTIQETANGQSSLSCDVRSASGSYRPEEGDEVSVTEGGTPIFGGIVQSPSERGIGNWGGSPGHITTVEAKSFDIYASWRVISEVIPAGTLKAALQVIEPYLAGYGVTLDAGQVNGPTLAELTFTLRRGDDVLNELASLTGYVWEIDAYKSLRMYLPSSVAAPFDVIDGDGHAQGDIQVERTQNENYTNRAILVVSGAGAATSSESFVAADGVVMGVFTRFIAKYPTSQSSNDLWPNELFFDGVSQGPIAFGVANLVDNGGLFGWAWDYTTSPAELVYDSTAPGVVFPTTETIAIAYAIRYPFTVTADNLTAQGVYGIRERVFDRREAMTIEAAQSLADGLVEQQSPTKQTATYDTDEFDIRPGMFQHITCAARDLDHDGVVSEVSTVRLTATRVRRTVSVQLADRFQGTYRDIWAQMLRGGGGTSAGSVSTTGVSGVAGVGGGGSTTAGSYALASSVAEWVQGSSWTAASGVQITINTSLRGSTSANVTVRLRARNSGIDVTPRLRNVDDNTTAGTGTLVTSTSFTTQTFAATLTSGTKTYELQLLPSASDEDVQAIGYLE